MPEKQLITCLKVTTLTAMLLFSCQASAYAKKGLQLRYNAETGQETSYRTIMEGTTKAFFGAQTSKTEMRTEMYVTQEVTGMTADAIDMKTRIDSGEYTVNGTKSRIPLEGREILSRMRPNGSIIEADQIPGLDVSKMQFVLPEGDIQIGTAWQEQILPSEDVPAEMTVSYRVAGFEEFAGRRCVRIDSEVVTIQKNVLSGLSINLRAKGLILFSPEEGKVIRNDTRSKMSVIVKHIVEGQEQRYITSTELKSRTLCMD